MEEQLPPGWEVRRSQGGSKMKYYFNTITKEATRVRPTMHTDFEVVQMKEKCADGVGEQLLGWGVANGDEAFTLGEYLVDVWGDVSTVQEFITETRDDAGGLDSAKLANIYHYINVSHPAKKADYLQSKQYREDTFDPSPPEGWEVRESTTTTGKFYYINKLSGETSVDKPQPLVVGGDGDENGPGNTGPGRRKPRRPKGEVLVVTEVEMKKDTSAPFLPKGPQAITSTATKLMKNSQGALAKAAALPSQLLETRRKTGGTGPTKQWSMNGETRRRLGRPEVDPRSLPVYAHRDGIVQAVRERKFLVVIGETGSGKTTQIPQYLCDLLEGEGIVACTQPRRVSAITVAKRVAAERKVPLGDEVGYSVRFEDKYSKATKIKYMTDGMLLRAFITNPLLVGYKVVMIDEAHERTLTTDLLLYLLKRLLTTTNTQLKVLISSATIDAGKFSKYFDSTSVYYIPGRTYPVETLYLHEREDDWYAMALKVVFEIHVNEGPGDILVFLTGQDEIDTGCQICYEWYMGMKNEGRYKDMLEMLILPLYSALPTENQTEIFEPTPAGCRKVIFSTNVAETSVTIDGVVYVVDCGFAKVKTHDPVYRMDCLMVTPISQAAARQRAGRAGRTGPGKCFRLYTEDSYDNEMLPQTIPEVQRASLETTVLTLKQYTDVDLDNLDLMDLPPASTIASSLTALYHLGALSDTGAITPLGTRLLTFPLPPHLAKALITSVDLDVHQEVAAVIAMLTCGSPVFLRPRAQHEASDESKKRLTLKQGDHMTYLKVFSDATCRRGEDLAEWCSDNYISTRALDVSKRIAEQLLEMLGKGGPWDGMDHGRVERVQEALCAGSGMKVARRFATEQGVVIYKTLYDELQAAVHPSSVFARLGYDDSPEWIIYNELVQTRREYMRDVSTIDPAWLVKYAPTLYVTTATEYRGLAAEAMRAEMAELRSSLSTDFQPARNEAEDDEEDYIQATWNRKRKPGDRKEKGKRRR